MSNGWVRRESLGIEWANEIIEYGEELIDELIDLLRKTGRNDILELLESVRDSLEEAATDYVIQMVAWLHDVSPSEVCINEEREDCKILLEYNSASRRFNTVYYIRQG